MTTSSAGRGEGARGGGGARPLDAMLAFAERALNRQIAESTAALDLLDELAGSSFAVHVEGLSITCVLRAEPERVALGTDASGATATLRARPIDLLRLVGADGLAQVRGTQAEISGDLQVAERFAKLLKLARPDLEEELSRWIGDIPAHALGRAAHGAGAWLKRAAQALRMNTAEYLQEESRALPAPLEAQGFYDDVERLRDDVERAAARLARLERR
ncbi:MAG TPA: SCP2 sterol-binding domain-containing protein [Gammaproteobacteria bacterium]|nr:SCP2 sterol-binding domain-containing protein [Gammaproteobacteria bacterium]